MTVANGRSGPAIHDSERKRPAIRVTLALETLEWLDSHAPRGKAIDRLVAEEIDRAEKKLSPIDLRCVHSGVY